MKTFTKRESGAILKRFGWIHADRGPSIHAQAVKLFQTGYLLGSPLKADGIIGPATTLALQRSVDSHERGGGTASPNFDFYEFACHCGQTLADCKAIWVRRELLESLERWRAIHYPGGLHLMSGYRCPRHNARVHGRFTDSQHQYGAAVDPAEQVHSVGSVTGLHLFAGIGFSPDRKVKHVDRRDVTRKPGTGPTRTNPVTFRD